MKPEWIAQTMTRLPQDELVQIEGVNLLGYVFLLRPDNRTFILKNKLYDLVISSLTNAKSLYHRSICLWTLGVFSSESLLSTPFHIHILSSFVFT